MMACDEDAGTAATVSTVMVMAAERAQKKASRGRSTGEVAQDLHAFGAFQYRTEQDEQQR